MPRVDWEAGYGSALEAVNAFILNPALAADWPRLAAYAQALAPAQRRSLLLAIAYRCWNGEQGSLSIVVCVVSGERAYHSAGRAKRRGGRIVRRGDATGVRISFGTSDRCVAFETSARSAHDV